MLDPQFSQLSAPPSAAPPGPDARRQDLRIEQAQLTMSACLLAARSACDCEACQVLRRLVDIMIADSSKGGGTSAPSGHPAP